MFCIEREVINPPTLTDIENMDVRDMNKSKQVILIFLV